MKRIDLVEHPVDLAQLLTLVQDGPVMLLAPNGKEYLLAEADDFDQEVEQLRNSLPFQAFLEGRTGHHRPWRALADLAREVDAEGAAPPESLAE
ncbi:MAG: hypothetical protein WCF99_04390 [Chloroflexales bacterium]